MLKKSLYLHVPPITRISFDLPCKVQLRSTSDRQTDCKSCILITDTSHDFNLRKTASTRNFKRKCTNYIRQISKYSLYWLRSRTRLKPFAFDHIYINRNCTN